MYQPQFMTLRLFLRSSNKGFTFTELLVAALMSTLIIAASTQLIVSLRGSFVQDRTRVTTNQDLRSGLDLIGADIKQTAELLRPEFPAIQVIDGGGSNPDQLILRRNLLTDVLTVCSNIPAGSGKGNITVSATNPNDPSNPDGTFADATFDVASPKLVNNILVPDGLVDATGFRMRISGCGAAPDPNPANRPQRDVENRLGPNLLDDLERWTEFRCRLTATPACEGSDQVQAFIYNIGTRQGEFFLYSDEVNRGAGTTAASVSFLRASGGGTWINNYPPGSAVYMIEERRFTLVPDPGRAGSQILQLAIDGNNAATQTYDLVNRLAGFQVRAKMQDGLPAPLNNSPIFDTFPQLNPDGSLLTAWNNLRRLEVTLTAKSTDIAVNNQQLSIASYFLPRNVLSADVQGQQ
jgi:hypothetical protein